MTGPTRVIHRLAPGPRGQTLEIRFRRTGLGGRGKRPKNKLNLVAALGKVLKKETLSVTDAAAAVQRIGYRTTSPNFRTIVNQALLANRKVFKKVGRGQYTAKAMKGKP